MYSIYRKKNAFQFELMNPKYNKEKGYIEKEGALFVSAANSIGDKKFDWNNKIVFAISSSDFGEILYQKYRFEKSGKTEINLSHFINDVGKRFLIKNSDSSGYNLGLYFGDNKVSTIIDSKELSYLFEIFRYASTKILF